MSKLFREKNLEKISSPEQMDDYMRVVTPGTWMFLVSVVIILCGAAYWLFAVKPF